MTQKCADFLVLFLFGLILIVLLALYAGGYLILGGEGNYFLDFTTAAKSGCYTWNSLMMGTGGIQPTPHFFFGIFDLFSFLRSLSLSLKTVNLISVFLVYFLPFAAMYLVLRRVLKIRLLHASLGALFYLLNPISTYHLSSAMFWNCAPNFVLPVTFGLIYKYFDDSRRLFIYFGLFSFLVSFCFSNIPYLGVFHISIFIFLWIASMILRNRVDLKRMIVNFICLEVSFVLFNAWWFLPLVQFQLQSVASFYHADSAVEWAKYAVGDGLMMNKLFSLTTLVPYFWSRHFNEYFFTRFYYHPGVRIFLLIPFMLLAFGLLQRNLRWKKSLPWIAFFILGVVFLNKGYNDPFKDAYIFLMEHIPFFTLFKSPLEKFGVLLIFLLALYLGLLLKGDRKGWMSMPLILYLVVCSLPYWTLNFMPDSEITDGKYVSSKFVYKPEYQAAVRKINEVPGEGRVLSLPGSHNYGVTLLNHENKYYQGMDPILYALNKGFVAAYSRLFNLNFDVLFRSISKPFFHRLLSLYHINQVMINKDLYPRFGFLEKETLQEMEDIFNNSQIYSKDQTISGAISLYDLKDEYVLPHIYGAVHGFWIEGSLAFLLPLAQSPLFEQPVAWVFPEWQNQEVLHEGWKDILSEKWSQILLVNRRFNDWVLEGLKGEALFETSQRKVGIEAIGTHGVCALTLSDLESEYFEVKKSGIYEVWIRSKEGSKDTDWNLIQVDSVILEQMDAKNRMGWQKSGEVRLEKGGHQVCKGVLGHYVKMCRQGEYEVVFCPRERFEELAQKLKGKDISYLFCPQEKQGIQSFDIALRCDQSYDLMGQFSRKETFKKTGEKFVKVYLAPFLKKGRFYKGLQGVRKMQPKMSL
ncbi:MAG: hypothetical protein HYS08_10255 [Chlamydiae bacterium]|nr:hypothetical protein [Chlamydiota bacterium]